MNRVASLSMTAVLGVLALLASAAGVVALWKVPSPGAAGLTLAWVALAGTVCFARGRMALAGMVLLLVTAFGARLFSISLVEAGRLGADAMNYANLAHAVLDGRGLIADDWRYGEGLRAYFPPLYPLALAGWWAVFGDSAASTCAMNTLIAAAAAIVLRDIALGLGKARAGTVAALIFFAWPSVTLAAAFPHKELLMLLLVLLFFRAAIVWETERVATWPRAMAIGVIWALMALTQAALALTPPVIALVLMPRNGWRRTLSLGLKALPVFLLVMAPWWLRNWLVFGQFVPFTTAAGFLVNVALDRYQLPIPPEVFAMTEPDRSGHMGRLALARIVAMPIQFFESVAIAFGRGFGYEEATIASYRHSRPPITPELRGLLTAPLQFAWSLLLGIATLACAKAYRDRDDGPLIPLLFATFVSICAIGMWFEFGERHRLMLTPLLILAAAVYCCRTPDQLTSLLKLTSRRGGVLPGS